MRKDASSEARKAMAFATSSGVPSRPSGVLVSQNSQVLPVQMSVHFRVDTPGDTQFNRIFEGPSSLEAALV